MKKLLLPLALGLGLLCGCSHPYVMKLSNGHQITTPSKPKLKDGAYHYKDAAGQDHIVPQGRVNEIEPVSMAKADNKFKVVEPKKKKKWYWPF